MRDGGTVLVTGGAGFIGRSVVRQLADAEWVDRVRVLDDLSTGSRGAVAGLDGVDLIEGSVTDADLVAESVEGCHAVVHLAAKASVPESIADPVTTADVNVMGTVNVLEAARRHGHLQVILASSSAVYGNDPTLRKNEGLRPRPMSPYASSKMAAESIALSYQQSLGLPVLALRPFNVYGPGQSADHPYAAAIPSFVRAGLADQPVTVYGDGQQTRDFVDVHMVATLITRAVQNGISSDQPVNVASGSAFSLLDLLAILETLLGHAIPRNHEVWRSGDVAHSLADVTRMRLLFPGLSPAPLTEGLQRTVEWFREVDPS